MFNKQSLNGCVLFDISRKMAEFVSSPDKILWCDWSGAKEPGVISVPAGWRCQVGQM